MLSSVLDLEERTRSGVLATVAQALRVFNRPGVLESVSCGTFRLDEALDEDGTVVLSLPRFRMDQVTPLFSSVLALIWATVQARVEERTGAPVRPLLLLVGSDGLNGPRPGAPSGRGPFRPSEPARRRGGAHPCGDRTTARVGHDGARTRRPTGDGVAGHGAAHRPVRGGAFDAAQQRGLDLVPRTRL